MNNVELEKKIREISAIDNYFDMVEAMIAFEKEYKTSDFYKKTKRPLEVVVKEARIHYALQLKDLGKRIQELLDNLSLDNVNELLDKMGGMFAQENEDIKEAAEVFKNLK